MLVIDGGFREAADGTRFPILDPATGERIGEAPDAGVDDMVAAVTAARRAFDDTTWSTDLALRIASLRRLHDALVDEGESMRALTTTEAGVPVRLTAGAHYDLPVEGLRGIADLAETDGIRGRAVGVVAAILPWSQPVRLALATIGPALAAGCTVVLKPAAETPWVAAELGRIAAGVLPPGVLNVVTTRNVDVAITLTTEPGVDLVAFAGSAVVGDRVRTTAGSAGTRVLLHLGGKPAAIVLGGDDLAAAVEAVAAAVCAHAGQGCDVATRLVVPRGRYDEAVAIAAATMEAIGTGVPTDPATLCGPVISAVHRDRVRRYLALAEQEGGTFATGGTVGNRAGGFWVEPTVIAGLTNQARVAREEICGPVLVVLAHDGDDDAARIAADSPYAPAGVLDSAGIEAFLEAGTTDPAVG